jgi:hypothetical protein
MTAKEAEEAAKSLSYEQLWATMDRLSEEADKRYREVAERFEELAEQHKKTEKLVSELAEQHKKTERLVERVSANVGGLNRSMGELVETLIAGRLWEKFEKYNLKRAYRRVPVYDDTERLRTDIDILLTNTDCAMVVEVKRELNKKDDVQDHLRRIELVRRYPPDMNLAGKRLMGAMAGGIVDPEVADYAYEHGLFVLELSGEMVRLVPPPEGFEPKEWP